MEFVKPVVLRTIMPVRRIMYRSMTNKACIGDLAVNIL